MKRGYIAADESTRTNVPGVFAVGDIRTKAVRQVVTRRQTARWPHTMRRSIWRRKDK